MLSGDKKRLDFGWWRYNAIYRWHIIHLYTWNLYKVVNECHPNKFNVVFLKKDFQKWIFNAFELDSGRLEEKCVYSISLLIGKHKGDLPNGTKKKPWNPP